MGVGVKQPEPVNCQPHSLQVFVGAISVSSHQLVGMKGIDGPQWGCQLFCNTDVSSKSFRRSQFVTPGLTILHQTNVMKGVGVHAALCYYSIGVME